MGTFEMCDACAAEYADPSNRRFHAQPDACFTCGPSLCFAVLTNSEQVDAAASAGTPSASVPSGSPTEVGFAPVNETISGTSKTLADSSTTNGFHVVELASTTSSITSSFFWARGREESDAIIARTVDMLAAGKIVAVKGLGGFHLVCDASNAATLSELRKRKRREGKAFAVMVPDADAARTYCALSAEEEALLNSPARPIVLLKKRAGARFATGLADKLPELGVMLPATPLQHLLLHDFEQATGKNMLVFTSGNVHDEPIQIDDKEACTALAGIADVLVGNNRAIRARYDDSVVRILNFGDGESSIQVIRRARGYAPLPIAVTAQAAEGAAAELAPQSTSQTKACIMATGPEQKNTFCLLDENRAFVSQHIGDMENAETFDAWLESKASYERLFELAPERVACDMHPEYLTSKWAHSQSLPVTLVQHHHAHIASAMAEHGLEGPAIGFAFDGTGAGPDGAMWGGEVLLSNLASYERFANFAYFPLPGGAAAIKHPLRCAYGALWAFDLLEHPAAARLIEALGSEASLCEQMIEQGINTPYTSSVGRLFDAASAILEVCTAPTYEGEAAILLEACMTQDSLGQTDSTPGSAASVPEPSLSDAYEISIIKNTATEQSTALDTSVVLLDAEALFRALLDDVEAGLAVPEIARKFHDAFVQVIVQLAHIARSAFDINTAVLAGGVFMNRYLIEQAVRALANDGFTVVMNKDLPPNDGSISFGQAIVASHKS